MASNNMVGASAVVTVSLPVDAEEQQDICNGLEMFYASLRRQQNAPRFAHLQSAIGVQMSRVTALHSKVKALQSK